MKNTQEKIYYDANETMHYTGQIPRQEIFNQKAGTIIKPIKKNIDTLLEQNENIDLPFELTIDELDLARRLKVPVNKIKALFYRVAANG